jgi:hypothetical protein
MRAADRARWATERGSDVKIGILFRGETMRVLHPHKSTKFILFVVL